MEGSEIKFWIELLFFLVALVVAYMIGWCNGYLKCDKEHEKMNKAKKEMKNDR